MTYQNGGTRRVFLIGKFAIKVAKINPFRVIARIICWYWIKHRFKMSLREMLADFVWRRITANRNEYAYWKETHDPRVMPTRCCLLFGLINIQERGLPVTVREFDVELFWDEIPQKDLLKSDLYPAHQYARSRTGSDVMLVDYGPPEAIEVLRRSSAAHTVRYTLRVCR